MKSTLGILGPVFLAAFVSVSARRNDKVISAAKATTITVLQNENNAVQLAIQINGQFVYPFTFTADPQLSNGITITPSGLISGTPSKADDQSTEITVADSNGKIVAKYAIVLHVASSVTVVLGSNANGGRPQSPIEDPRKQSAADTLTIDPVYVGGDTVTGTAKPESSVGAGSQKNGGGKVQSDGSGASQDSTKDGSGASNSQHPAQQASGGTVVTITCAPNPDKPKPNGKNEEVEDGCKDKMSATVLTDKTDSFSYQFNRSLYEGDTVSVSIGSGKPLTNVVQKPPILLGEDMRAIVGYQQTGASSSDFTQNWFLDFYISRPLALLRKSEGNRVKWRWWGNVRVASFPQPGNQTLADLASSLPSQLGALKLNQLAQGAEFLSGIEFQPFRSFPFRGFSENTRQVFAFGLIAAVGATGFFSAPSNNVQVFAVPPAGSPQLGIFQKTFPSVTTSNVAFISPDVERFPKQYFAGIRLRSHYVAPTGKPLTSSPAMLAFTVGQNAVITGDQLHGVVGRVEAFYPLPFGNRGQTTAGAFSSLYLFGEAQMRLGGSQTAPPLVLAPVTGVHPYDPSVTLVPLPNTRDEYRVGFGVDLVGMISSLTGGTAKQATTATTTSTSKADKAKENPQPAAVNSGTPHN